MNLAVVGVGGAGGRIVDRLTRATVVVLSNVTSVPRIDELKARAVGD